MACNSAFHSGVSRQLRSVTIKDELVFYVREPFKQPLGCILCIKGYDFLKIEVSIDKVLDLGTTVETIRFQSTNAVDKFC